MSKTERFLTTGLLLLATSALVFFTAGCNKLRARDQLNKGIQAYKTANYEGAIERFRNAVQFDDNLLVARLYLATAYTTQVVPGADNPENLAMAQRAIDTYQEVLKRKPEDTTSLKGIASLYFGMKKYDQARDYQNKVLALDGNDAEAYYWIGVIDWSKTYLLRMSERNKLGLNPDDPLKDKRVCDKLRGSNLDAVNEAIDMLAKAMDKRQDYDDAMAYMNLIYREKADIECGDPESAKKDLDEADKWVQKTKDTRKMKAEKSNSGGGIVMDSPTPADSK